MAIVVHLETLVCFKMVHLPDQTPEFLRFYVNHIIGTLLAFMC